MTITQRIDLEKNIIGSVLCDDLFGNVAHILSHKNFTSEIPFDINHQFIWAAIAACYPCKPISTITVLLELKKSHPEIDFDNYKFHLIQYQKSRVAKYSSGIIYYAILLLEQDIIEKYSSLLISIKDRVPSHELIAIASITDACNLVQLYDVGFGEDDIFDIIEHTNSYLEKIGFPLQLLDELKLFYTNIEIRISTMKLDNRINIIIHNLSVLSANALAANALKEVCEIITKLLKETKPEYVEWLKYINTEMK